MLKIELFWNTVEKSNHSKLFSYIFDLFIKLTSKISFFDKKLKNHAKIINLISMFLLMKIKSSPPPPQGNWPTKKNQKKDPIERQWRSRYNQMRITIKNCSQHEWSNRVGLLFPFIYIFMKSLSLIIVIQSLSLMICTTIESSCRRGFHSYMAKKNTVHEMKKAANVVKIKKPHRMDIKKAKVLAKIRK